MEQEKLKQFYNDLVSKFNLSAEYDEFADAFKAYQSIENETKIVKVAYDEETDEAYYEEVECE